MDIEHVPMNKKAVDSIATWIVRSAIAGMAGIILWMVNTDIAVSREERKKVLLELNQIRIENSVAAATVFRIHDWTREKSILDSRFLENERRMTDSERRIAVFEAAVLSLKDGISRVEQKIDKKP